MMVCGEGNGNPLQCSCLENPRDGGAWWAAIYGVTQRQTRLKRSQSLIQNRKGDLPDSPVVKTLPFHHHRPWVRPLVRSQGGQIFFFS